MSRRRFLIVMLVLALAAYAVKFLPEIYHLAWYFIKPLATIFIIVQARSERQKAVDVEYVDGLGNAFIFSLFGDILLMFNGQWAFGLGLFFFLLAHLCFIKTFKLFYHWNSAALLSVALLLFFGASIFFLIAPNLHYLFIPVLIYMLFLLGMGHFAFQAPQKWTAPAAILFILSDTILGLNQFYSSIPFASLLILGTYYLAQILFVFSIEKRP